MDGVIKSKYIIGILRETSTAWERRVTFTPDAVRNLIENHHIQIIIQSSSNRCFSDSQYKEAGALI